ncbi:hypothetical protein CXX84_01035 [Arthrobacter sp. AFG7.2]|uniref:DUF6416 domain-containing protein n=1 Tax=Arthrobacter sp. AFG7.2 TaxID=1688693 RepID=UPI000C9EA4FA|nr:DUF6416 domain-containing protein [Arthrobacter sp. AFG7.2]PNI10095.1 hypothetical protein CXX84_01035 [Arthrobacter sp. AFG7.2]
MPDITVPVPDDRVPEFYQFFGMWLGGSSALPGGTIQTFPEDSKEAGKRRHWTGLDEDREDAEKLWSKLTSRAKGLYNLMIDAPGIKFTGDQIAKELNIANGASGVRGVLAWPGRYCWNMNRRLPQRWKDGEDGAPSAYWMEPDVAALFKAVRADLDG